MIKDLLQSISKVYIAYGATDFRKQIDSLCIEVKSKFHLNQYEKAEKNAKEMAKQIIEIEEKLRSEVAEYL